MKKTKLKNGLTIIYHKKQSDSIAIEITVKTGSNNEDKKTSGISHFIEHIVFEGTENYTTSKELANEIEKYGGELNAYTEEERTVFYIKIIKKHFDIALKVLENIVFKPTLKQQIIDKERKIILDEIKMVTDEPRFQQWVFFAKTLFEKHPSKNPIYGTKEAVKAITRKELIEYYKKHYIPNNIIITVVGDIDRAQKLIEKKLSKYKLGKIVLRQKIKEPKQIKPKIAIQKKEVSNSYAVLGYKTPNRLDKESYALDIIGAILGRGQSGKIFYEIRTKRGLAYEVGVHHEPEKDCGSFAIYFGTDKKNINKIVKIALEELNKIQKITDLELIEAKDYIEGSHKLHMEDTFRQADDIGYWALIGKPQNTQTYISTIRKITIDEVKKVAKKYFTKNYTLAIIKQKK